MERAASAAIGIVVGLAVSWFMLRRSGPVRLRHAAPVGALAIALLWAWAAHAHRYPGTFGPFYVTMMGARVLRSARRAL